MMSRLALHFNTVCSAGNNVNTKINYLLCIIRSILNIQQDTLYMEKIVSP